MISKITRVNNVKRAGQVAGKRSSLTIPSSIAKKLEEAGTEYVYWLEGDNGDILLRPVKELTYGRLRQG